MSRLSPIRTFADLIERLEPDPYVFFGHYWLESQPEHRKEIKFDCEFTNDTQAVVASWDHSNFELRILFAGASAQLFVRGLGYINGRVLFADRNVLLSARNDVAAVFGHIFFEDDAVIHVAGTFEANRERFVYALSGSLATGPASLANVRALAKRA